MKGQNPGEGQASVGLSVVLYAAAVMRSPSSELSFSLVLRMRKEAAQHKTTWLVLNLTHHCWGAHRDEEEEKEEEDKIGMDERCRKGRGNDKQTAQKQMATILTQLQACVLNRLMEGLLQDRSREDRHCNNTNIDESFQCVHSVCLQKTWQFRCMNTKAALISAFFGS